MPFLEIYQVVAGKCSHVITQRLLQTLLNVNDKLTVVERRLEQIQNGPYVSGIDYLNQSAIENSYNDRIVKIDLAAKSFNTAASQTDGMVRALSYFFEGCCNDLLGKSRIAVYKYSQAFRAACQFESKRQDVLKNSSSLSKKLNLGASGVSATAGSAVGAYAAFLLGTPITFGVAAAPVSLPILGLGAAAGVLIGGSPFYLTSKAGDIGLKFWYRGLVREADGFFENFTKPLAAVLVERSYDGPARQLVDDVNSGTQPQLEILKQYVDDDKNWPVG